MKRWNFGLIIIIVAAFLAVGCGGSATPAPTPVPTEHPGEKLVAERCVGCHQLWQVEAKSLSKEGWQAEVDRMIISGAKLNSEEEALVVDYLAITHPAP